MSVLLLVVALTLCVERRPGCKVFILSIFCFGCALFFSFFNIVADEGRAEIKVFGSLFVLFTLVAVLGFCGRSKVKITNE